MGFRQGKTQRPHSKLSYWHAYLEVGAVEAPGDLLEQRAHHLAKLLRLRHHNRNPLSVTGERKAECTPQSHGVQHMDGSEHKEAEKPHLSHGGMHICSPALLTTASLAGNPGAH